MKTVFTTTLATFAIVIAAQHASAQVCENGVCRLRPGGPATLNRQYETIRFDGYDTGYQQPHAQQGYSGADCKCGPDGVCGPNCNCGPDCVNCRRNHQQPDYGVTRNRPLTDSSGRNSSGYLRAPAPGRTFNPVSYRPNVNWEADFERAAELARRTRRPLLVRVGAKWCGYCNQMKQQTFADQRIIADISQGFVAVDIDADRHPELIKRMRVRSLPTTLVMSPDLRILDRQEGFRSASELGRVLSRYVQRAELSTPTRVVCR